MAETQPVAAATLQEIKAAYPKAKAEFVLKCLEKSMPMASVAQSAIEEMMAENAALRAEIKAMQEEMAGKAKAMEGEDEEPVAVEHEEEEMEVAPVAKARRVGVAPVARGQGVSHSASIRWDSVVTTCLAKCNGNKVKAVAMANKQNPGLRQAYLDEINARK
jgi:hypothetical protein